MDGWTVVIPDTWTIMDQVDRSKPGSSLRAGLCSFPCLLLHLRALALYKISNRHTVDDSLKLNTNETKFRAYWVITQWYDLSKLQGEIKGRISPAGMGSS